jgi:formamidopyrimidine-DNA glycosylase
VPELPEVEFCRRALTRWTRGRRVIGADVLDRRSVRLSRTDRPSAGHPDGAEALRSVVVGEPAGPIDRHGKRLLWQFGNNALLLHLGMTGKWARQAGRWPKVRLDLDDGSSVWFSDPRLLGGVVPTTLAEGRSLLSADLGPDALTEGLPALPGRRPVKLALLDQATVAGVGNIVAMESLWRAGIHPETRCDELTPDDHARLRDAVRAQILDTIAMQGEGDEIIYVEESLAANPFALYRREGTPCPRCGAPIARLVQGGRSTYWCPRCQPGR